MPLIEITDTNGCDKFETVFNKDKVIIIYHWNNCGHCVNLMNTLDSLFNQSAYLKQANIFQVELEKIPLLEQLKKPELTDVSFFPSIISYNRGKKVDEFRESRRDETNIKKFIEENSSISSSLGAKSALTATSNPRLSANSTTIRTVSAPTTTRKIRVLKSSNKKFI